MEVPVFSLGTKPIPFARFEDDESWLWRTRYGWTDNGELHKVSGSAVWETNSPPIPYLSGEDTHLTTELAGTIVPNVNQPDDEAWLAIELTNNAIIIPYLPGNDTHIIYTLGSQTIPAIDQNDDEAFVHEYPGNI